jgi:hypothetical protein
MMALVVGIYERYEKSKEIAREHFRMFILKPEFFEFLTAMMDVYEVLLRTEQIVRTGTAHLFIGGRITEIHDARELRPILDRLEPQLGKAHGRMKKSGVFFLMPPKVREAYEELLTVLYPLPAVIDETYLALFRKRFLELSNSLTKALGIAKLV